MKHEPVSTSRVVKLKIRENREDELIEPSFLLHGVYQKAK